MPIIYDEEKQGFRLKDPTEAETAALEKLAIDFITVSMAKAAALATMGLTEDEDKGTMQ